MQSRSLVCYTKTRGNEKEMAHTFGIPLVHARTTVDCAKALRPNGLFMESIVRSRAICVESQACSAFAANL
jgi:hypothetical protein